MSMYRTIMTDGYTTQNGDNPAAGGGVTHRDVTVTAAGEYRMRSIDSNGRQQSVGKSERVSPQDVVAAIERAIERGDGNGGLSSRQASKLVSALQLSAYTTI